MIAASSVAFSHGPVGILPAMTDPTPLISVVIAVRNGAATIQRALDSVFAQTYELIEIVVIDGASTDGTQAVIERNAARIAYHESEPDRGIYDAWNKALDHVTGDWICFLGADDRYHADDVLARMAAAIAADEGPTTSSTARSTWSVPTARSTGPAHSRSGTSSRRRAFRRGGMIPHPATFHQQVVFDEHGRFDETFRIAGDYEFLLRELLTRDALCVDIHVVDMSIHGISDRPSNRSLVQREIYRARYMHGLVTTPAWRSPALARRLFRVWLTNTFGKDAGLRARDAYRSLTRRGLRRR